MERYFESVNCKNIKEIVYNSAKKFAENVAFVIKHKNEKKEVSYESITYKKLLQDVNEFGTKLYDMGLKNKRVAIVGRNRYEWVVAHLSNLLGGIVSIPLDKELQVDELESCLERSKADVIVFDEKYIDNIEKIKQNGKTNLQEYVCMTEQEGYKNFWTLKKEGAEILKNGNNEYVNCEIDNDKMAILLFTSGTTSKSKAVMLSNTNIASNVYAMLLVEDMRPTDNNLAFLPFHHIFGSTCMIVMIAIGAKTAFPDGLRYVAQNLKEYQISLFVGVPLLVEAIYKNIEKEIEKKGKTKLINNAKKLSNCLLKLHIDVRRKLFKDVIDALGGRMRFIISGGAPLDKKVAQGFNELGIEVVQGYGLTETSPVVAIGNKKYHKTGSIGKCVPSDEVKLLDINKDGIGELAVKGPNVMLEYYENKEATEKVLKDGWFQTGDLARIDEDGYIFICGRKKSVIVLKNGKNIFPEEMETLINKEDGVEESFIFGKPISKDPNDIKIFVKIVYNKESFEGKTETEIKEYFNEKIKSINKTMPHYKAIRGIIISDKPLIKTTTNKIKREKNLEQIIKEL